MSMEGLSSRSCILNITRGQDLPQTRSFIVRGVHEETINFLARLSLAASQREQCSQQRPFHLNLILCS